MLIVRPAPGTPGSGSINTLLPGLTYACATVMKVCLVAGMLATIASLCVWTCRRRQPFTAVPVPRWAIASVALAPVSTLSGALAAVIFQRLILTAAPVTIAQFQQIAPAPVFTMIAVLAAGAIAAVRSLMLREKPPAIATLGLAVNAILIALFLYMRFHAPGFDQDTWAPRAF